MISPSAALLCQVRELSDVMDFEASILLSAKPTFLRKKPPDEFTTNAPNCVLVLSNACMGVPSY
jgi:hypothetical protein